MLLTTSRCCYVTYRSTYDGDTGRWSPPVEVRRVDECHDPVPWYSQDLESPCTYETKILFDVPVGQYQTALLPEVAPPDFYPPECCVDCCRTIWVSAFDCTTLTWGTPTVFSQVDDSLCELTTGWYFGGPTSCLAFLDQYTAAGGCPVEGPPAPEIYPPPECCEISAECGSAQPAVTVSGFDADLNGVWPFESFSDSSAHCTWRWLAGEPLDVTYNKQAETWTVSGPQAAAPEVTDAVFCNGGVITGSFTYLAAGRSVTIAFG